MRGFFILVLFVHLVGVLFSVGYHHVDEHFQLLEFSAMKRGITPAEDLPWEYAAQMRPSFQVAVAYSVEGMLSAVNIDNPFHQAMFLRFLSAMLALLSIWFFTQANLPSLKEDKYGRMYLFLSFLSWIIVYLNIRYSSESWSSSWFILACGLYLNPKYQEQKWVMPAMGIALGISFICRYQTGFMVMGLGLWLLLIKQENWKRIAMLILGFLLVVGVGVVSDRWFYGDWVCSAWNYVDQNLVQNKAASFGVQPLWYYAQHLSIVMVPPFSLILLIALVYFFIRFPKHYITWIIIPFLLIHHIIGHKEGRFLFPIFNLFPLVIAMCLEQWREKYTWAKYALGKWLSVGFVVVNSLLLIVCCLKPADGNNPMFNYIYAHYQQPANLYYVKTNPYIHTAPVHFYRPKNLNTIALDSLPQVKTIDLSDGQKKLFICKLYTSEHRDFLTQNPKMTEKCVYQNYPKWLEKYNYGNWLEGLDDAWVLYEME